MTPNDPVSSMLATAVSDASASSRIVAVAFDGHFGSLHLPPPQLACGVTVVLCPPVGRDARCAYRALFRLAGQLSNEGFAVLRYDHRGGGDSLPLGEEADHWPVWLDSVSRAAQFARSYGGGTRLVLGGLRIGASLAALAVEAVAPDALMLLAPLASGKAWTRELQMSAAMTGAPTPPDGAIEIDGLRLNRATIESVNGFDLRRMPAPSVPVLLAAPAADPKLAAALGPKTDTLTFAGYAHLFREAHLNMPPTQLFEEVCEWLCALPAGEPQVAAKPPAARFTTPDWTEEAICFGPGLRGILTLPACPGAGEAVIFGNTGADPRFGIGSFAAEAARALAAEGAAALRFDFAGFGESDGRTPDEWRPHIYLTSRVDDFRAASAVLEMRGFDDITLAGICAGGHQALRAAMNEPRFNRVMAINTFLVWRPLLTLESKPAEAPSRLRVNVAALLKPSGWRRLISGEVDPKEALKTLYAMLMRRYGPRRLDAACREMRAGVGKMSRRGAQVRLIVGRDDESIEGLERDFGASGAWLARQPGFEVKVRARLDHGLFSRDCRMQMIAELAAFVRSTPPRRRPRRLQSAAWAPAASTTVRAVCLAQAIQVIP